MPALIHFNRKWLIACDDFVIPFAIETVLRLVWLTASVIVTWLVEISNCHDPSFVKYFFYIFVGQFILTILLCIGIFVTSSRGSVLQTQKRRHLPKILYAKCITVFIDLALLIWGAWILSQESNICSQWRIFIEAAVACLSLYMIAVIIGIFVCYNFMGSPSYWKTSANSIKIFKKAEKVWRFRLKFFCCCADVSEYENEFVYVEISSFLSTFSSDIDLAPTDILAGLITVCKKHAIERRKYNGPCEPDIQLANRPKPSWMTAENALYYLRIAKSTYGWVAFFSPLYPWKLCPLLSPSRCCKSLFCKSAMKEGDPFSCDSSAMERISGISDKDVLYASFVNSIYEPAFIVTFDHTRKAVIIAIRGTCSFSDLVTDMDGDEVNLPSVEYSDKVKCHRGALRSALFIQKKINELQILKAAFAEQPTYTLVITGHSLGGSIASILSLLLHQEYPSLQCYSYAPLAVISAEGIDYTYDSIFTVVVGDDISPRLSVYSCKELIREICLSLEETQIPKYKLLAKSFWKYITKSWRSHKVLRASEGHENKHVETKSECPAEDVQIDITQLPHKAQLYAAGRILYFSGPNRSNFSWVTGHHFQRILISPSIMKDHQPHQIQFVLEKHKESVENAAIPQVQQDLSLCAENNAFEHD